MKITAEDIRKLLRKKFDDRHRWLHASEVADCTGWQHRRLDWVIVNCWDSDGLSIDGFEIKISREDLKRELTDPDKHCVFFDEIDTFTLVCPREIIDFEVIPAKWGLLCVVEDKEGNRTLKWVRKPFALHDKKRDTIGRKFGINLMRRVSYASDAVAEMARNLDAKYQEGIAEGMRRCNRDDRYWKVVPKEDAEKVETFNEFIKAAGLYWTSKENLLKVAKWYKVLDGAGYTESRLAEDIAAVVERANELAEKVRAFLEVKKAADAEVDKALDEAEAAGQSAEQSGIIPIQEGS